VAMENRRKYTLAEIARTFFPDQVLERLESSLCAHFDLHYDFQHDLRRSRPEEPLLGTVEVAKTTGWYNGNKDYIEGLVKDFYKTEGYEVDDKNGIEVKNNKNRFDVIILETDTSFMVSVIKPIFR
jgi:hypothetical protein